VEPTNALTAPVVVERPAVEIWSDPEISTSTSSPILVGDRVYVTKEKGDFVAVDANTGKVHWSVKLGIEQRNACPLFADGRIYIPILADPGGKDKGDSSETGTKGGFYILRDRGDDVETLSHIELEGRCFGTPAAHNGKIYVQTARKLYAFGKAGDNPGRPKPVTEPAWPASGAARQLQIIPSEVLLHPGEKASFRVRKLDANGLWVEDVADLKSKWSTYIPRRPWCGRRWRGSSTPRASWWSARRGSARAYEAGLGGLKVIRGQVLPPAVRGISTG
jgi:hypothetical protein